MELLFSGTLSVGSLVFLSPRNPPASLAIQLEHVRLQAYGTPDVVFTTILVLLLLMNIFGSSDRLVGWTRAC